MKNRFLVVLIASVMLLVGCGSQGTSAEELTQYYADQAAEKAAEKAKELAKEAASEGASKINQAIDENETASKVKQGVTTAGEYAQDAYDYATDENTIKSAKDTAKEVGEDSVNFFDYMISKMGRLWDGVVENIEKGPAGATSTPMNSLEDLQNASEYDFYGPYTNPFKEAKGIDTSSEGTAMDQLKVAYGEFSESTKETIRKIKENHDAKHPKTSSNTADSSSNTQSGNTDANNTQTPQNNPQTLQNDYEAESVDTGIYTQTISELLLPIIPEYKGNPYCIINDNKPFFNDDELTTQPFEIYSELDSLGRCGVAYANACWETMPTEERGSIGNIRPTGFKQKRWDTLKTDENPYGYTWARCHEIGFLLCGENDNPKNLITGTFYFNVEGMEPFELATSYYIKSTNHHVLYRVTPIFKDNELVARGVLMEARSVEDDELSFCVYVYNVAPGININYATGETSLTE